MLLLSFLLSVGKTTLLNLIAGRIPTRCLGSGAAGTGGIVMQVSTVSCQNHGWLSDSGPCLCAQPSSLLRSCLSDGSQYEGCGEILFNGRVPTSAKLRELIGYGRSPSLSLLALPFCSLPYRAYPHLPARAVQQFDFHLPSLTVRETLLFHANMRLPRSMEVYKRQQRVQQVGAVAARFHHPTCHLTATGAAPSLIRC